MEDGLSLSASAWKEHLDILPDDESCILQK